MGLKIPFRLLHPAATSSLVVVTRGPATTNDRGRSVPGSISHVTVNGVTMPPSRNAYPELFDQSSGQRVEDARIFYIEDTVDISVDEESYIRHNSIFYRIRRLANWPGYKHLIGYAQEVDFTIVAGRAFSDGFSLGFA